MECSSQYFTEVGVKVALMALVLDAAGKIVVRRVSFPNDWGTFCGVIADEEVCLVTREVNFCVVVARGRNESSGVLDNVLNHC